MRYYMHETKIKLIHFVSFFLFLFLRHAGIVAFPYSLALYAGSQ